MISLGKTSRKKKIRKRTRTSPWVKWQKKHQKSLHILLPITGLLILVIALFWIIQNTLLASKHTIKDILYAPESIATYDDPYLYKAIADEVLEKNYYLMKWYTLDDIRMMLQEQFPIIRDITTELSDDQRVYITVDFYEPTLVFQTPTQYVAAYQGELFPLVTGNTLGAQTRTIQLPRYTSGATSLYGILYEMDALQLKTEVETIIGTLGEQHISEIIYLPGGMKLFITYKGKRIYFHLDQEINRQLAKLIDLENHFQDFDSIRTIDLGSIDDIIVR